MHELLYNYACMYLNIKILQYRYLAQPFMYVGSNIKFVSAFSLMFSLSSMHMNQWLKKLYNREAIQIIGTHLYEEKLHSYGMTAKLRTG